MLAPSGGLWIYQSYRFIAQRIINFLVIRAALRRRLTRLTFIFIVRATRARRSLSFVSVINVRATLTRRWQPLPRLWFISNVFVWIWWVNQIDSFRGFNSIFPFRGGFKNPVVKLIARLNNWFNLGRPCCLALFSPFALFALFPLFVLLPVPNSIYQALSSHLFVIAKDLLSFSLSYGASGPLGLFF
jgi:hypothetical protein